MEVLRLLIRPAYWWWTLGTAAFFLALVTLFRAIAGHKRGQELLRFVSLSCALGAMLSQYYLVNGWVAGEDWSALLDCVPPVAKLLTVAVIVGLGLHLAALVIEKWRDSRPA